MNFVSNLLLKTNNFILILLVIVLFFIATYIAAKKRARSITIGQYLVSLILAIAMCAAIFIPVHIYDKNFSPTAVNAKMIFYDKENNKYSYNYDKGGLFFLYINDTNEKVDADLCFVDDKKCLYYDIKRTITISNAKCSDESGKIYYPISSTNFSSKGEIKSTDIKIKGYDRDGTAYSYESVPYFDKDNNKYYYSFDADENAGYYINIETGKALENEYCFIDDEGYLIYSNDNSLVLADNNTYKYKDNDGNTLYWASSIEFDENGKIKQR